MSLDNSLFACNLPFSLIYHRPLKKANFSAWPSEANCFSSGMCYSVMYSTPGELQGGILRLHLWSSVACVYFTVSTGSSDRRWTLYCWWASGSWGVGKCSESWMTANLWSEFAGASAPLKTQWDFTMEWFLTRLWSVSFMSCSFLFEIQVQRLFKLPKSRAHNRKALSSKQCQELGSGGSFGEPEPKGPFTVSHPVRSQPVMAFGNSKCYPCVMCWSWLDFCCW